MTKEELRKLHKSIRDNIPNGERMKKSGVICSKLADSKLYRSAETVMLYYPIGSEVDVRLLIESAQEDKKTVVLPRCKDGERNIEACVIDGFSSLRLGKYGIQEPDENNRVLNNKGNIDIIIVPAIAIDCGGNRIGYGAGYYDRFLSDVSAVKIGVVFKENVINAPVMDVSQFDIPMDIVVTDGVV